MTGPTMFCPGCERPPRIVLDGGHQAFCGNDECHVMMWDTTMSLEELMREAQTVDMPDFGGDDADH